MLGDRRYGAYNESAVSGSTTFSDTSSLANASKCISDALGDLAATKRQTGTPPLCHPNSKGKWQKTMSLLTQTFLANHSPDVKRWIDFARPVTQNERITPSHWQVANCPV